MNKIDKITALTTARDSLLTINGGSSSIKFAIFDDGQSLEKIGFGKIDRIGYSDCVLKYTDLLKGAHTSQISIGPTENTHLVLTNFLAQQDYFKAVKVIVHRFVHGLEQTATQDITPQLIHYLSALGDIDPDHIPDEVTLAALFLERFSDKRQVACFDTLFHHNLPFESKRLAVPKRFVDKGLRRYGFHGISYHYIVDKLARKEDLSAKHRNLIIAHLGSGSSLAAIKEGSSFDTTMGFTPAGGVAMSTRLGDIDPGAAVFMMRSESLTVEAFNEIIHKESGLKALSESSSDLRDLLKMRPSDPRADEAIRFFCYQVRKAIGGFAAALGGLDTLVFCGGIGENAPEIRKEICEGLKFMGIFINDSANQQNELLISDSERKEAKVAIYVIPTDEELMMAKLAYQLTKNADESKP